MKESALFPASRTKPTVFQTEHFQNLDATDRKLSENVNKCTVGKLRNEKPDHSVRWFQNQRRIKTHSCLGRHNWLNCRTKAPKCKKSTTNSADKINMNKLSFQTMTAAEVRKFGRWKLFQESTESVALTYWNTALWKITLLEWSRRNLTSVRKKTSQRLLTN